MTILGKIFNFFKRALVVVSAVIIPIVCVASVSAAVIPTNQIKPALTIPVTSTDYENYINPNFSVDNNFDNIHRYLFTQFIQQFSKKYSIDEYNRKFSVFIENLYKIMKHNIDPSHTYKLGINEYADLTLEEFTSTHIKHTIKQSSGCIDQNSNVNSTIKFPPEVNWIVEGIVTPVKDQGQCGSCYSFSVTGALEGAYAIKNKKLISFSEQELVDCSSKYGDEGCDGGLMTNGFNFIMDNGLCAEKDYPYKASVGTCKKCTPVAGSKLIGCFNVPSNELDLTIAISKQPISVAIEADTNEFQFYKSGVFNNPKCGTNLDHAVLAVGYGTDKQSGLDYYIVKNSWGNWGENGYIRILRNSIASSTVGLCGIAKMTSYPKI